MCNHVLAIYKSRRRCWTPFVFHRHQSTYGMPFGFGSFFETVSFCITLGFEITIFLPPATTHTQLRMVCWLGRGWFFAINYPPSESYHVNNSPLNLQKSPNYGIWLPACISRLLQLYPLDCNQQTALFYQETLV